MLDSATERPLLPCSTKCWHALMSTVQRLPTNGAVRVFLIFSWKAIVDPIPEEALQSRKAYQVWLRTFLDFDVQEARRGNIVSPWKAACDVLRDVRDNLRNAIDFGALSAESHHEFMKHVHSCNESVGRRISP